MQNDLHEEAKRLSSMNIAGVITKEEALGRLKYEKPNHQICILNGQMIDRHLHFIKAEKI